MDLIFMRRTEKVLNNTEPKLICLTGYKTPYTFQLRRTQRTTERKVRVIGIKRMPLRSILHKSFRSAKDPTERDDADQKEGSGHLKKQNAGT